MEKSKIILASGSPRRKELLLQIGIVPEIIVSHVEEKITSDVPAEGVMQSRKPSMWQKRCRREP